jgi:hypothetical protein
MTRTTYSLLALAGACAALIAGCGGGGSNSNSSTTRSSKTVASKSASSSRSSTATSQSTTPTLPSLGAVGGAAAADCSSALAAAKTLTATQRSQFESYCASLKNDTPAQLKGALKTVCLEILKDTVPAADRSLAAATCAKL